MGVGVVVGEAGAYEDRKGRLHRGEFALVAHAAGFCELTGEDGEKARGP
jgi:hypothetical protein